ARPGGTVTGLSTPSLAGKQLDLLHQAIPGLLRVAVLVDLTTPAPDRGPYDLAARSLGLQLQFWGAAGPADLESFVDAARRERADGLLISAGPMISANQMQIAELVVQRRLP